MKLLFSNIVKAFDMECVGTRILSEYKLNFLREIEKAIEKHEREDAIQSNGQYFIVMPPHCKNYVLCGVGKKTNNPNDYVVRSWRGECGLYLKREHAASCDSLAVVVYTKDAFMDDPETKDAEREMYASATHVLIAVLGFAGPQSMPSPWTFVRNLAWANNEEQNMSADEIRAKAKKIHDYHSEWAIVAD